MKLTKTIFWNVDTQYDFMRNDKSFHGKLAIPGARSIEANLEKLTKYARLRDILIVNTADWHTPDSKELSSTPDYKTTFPPHCLQGTLGAAFIPATSPDAAYAISWQDQTLDEKALAFQKEIIIYKDQFCVFAGNPHTEKVLDILKPDRVFVYGVATNVCVNYAVLGLVRRNIEVIVIKDAIKELPNLPLDTIMEKWEEHGIRFTTTEEIIRM